MNKILIAVLGLALSGCATLGEAGSLADLAVVDRSNGQRLQTYYHQGRYWIAGTPGNNVDGGILLLTLFRLALNISSSRLILLNGNTGTSAAGRSR